MKRTAKQAKGWRMEYETVSVLSLRELCNEINGLRDQIHNLAVQAGRRWVYDSKEGLPPAGPQHEGEFRVVRGKPAEPPAAEQPPKDS